MVARPLSQRLPLTLLRRRQSRVGMAVALSSSACATSDACSVKTGTFPSREQVRAGPQPSGGEGTHSVLRTVLTPPTHSVRHLDFMQRGPCDPRRYVCNQCPPQMAKTNLLDCARSVDFWCAHGMSIGVCCAAAMHHARLIECRSHLLLAGFALTGPQLADWMLKLQDEGQCHNINFVTPEHVAPQASPQLGWVPHNHVDSCSAHHVSM